MVRDGVEREGLEMHFIGWAYPLEAYFNAMERARFVVEAQREPQGGRCNSPEPPERRALAPDPQLLDVARGQNLIHG